MKSNVYIFTEAGENIGLGHISRCLSLYYAFYNKNINVQIILDSNTEIKDLLNVKHSYLNWKENLDQTENILENCDIAIIDSYTADYGVYELISKKAKYTAFIDDTNRIDYPKGAIINGSLFADKIGYKDVNSDLIIGKKYIMLKKEFWDRDCIKIKKNIESILITLGGFDKHNLTTSILTELSKKYPNVEKYVIIGAFFNNTFNAEDFSDKKINFVYSPSTLELIKVMLKCDLAISAGGQTIAELASLGIPTIGFSVIDNQDENVSAWEREGFIENCGKWHDNSFYDNITNSIEKLKDQELREEKSNIGRKLASKNGVMRVVDKLISNMGNYNGKDN